jgi:hypothetical protein
VFRALALALLLTTCPATSLAAQTKPSQAEIELAISIVNEYRKLRSSCNDIPVEQRKMCYYRLRIGLWDYRQARETLKKNNIKSSSAQQLANH